MSLLQFVWIHHIFLNAYLFRYQSAHSHRLGIPLVHLLEKKADLNSESKIYGGRSNKATGHQDVRIAQACFKKLATFIHQVCGSSNGQQAPEARQKRDASAVQEPVGSASSGRGGRAAAASLSVAGASSSRGGSRGGSGRGGGGSGGDGSGRAVEDDVGQSDRKRKPPNHFNFSTDGADDSTRRKRQT